MLLELVSLVVEENGAGETRPCGGGVWQGNQVPEQDSARLSEGLFCGRGLLKTQLLDSTPQILSDIPKAQVEASQIMASYSWTHTRIWSTMIHYDQLSSIPWDSIEASVYLAQWPHLYHLWLSTPPPSSPKPPIVPRDEDLTESDDVSVLLLGASFKRKQLLWEQANDVDANSNNLRKIKVELDEIMISYWSL